MNNPRMIVVDNDLGRANAIEAALKIQCPVVLRFANFEENAVELQRELDTDECVLLMAHARNLVSRDGTFAGPFVIACSQVGTTVVLYSGGGVTVRKNDGVAHIDGDGVQTEVQTPGPGVIIGIGFPVLHGSELPLDQALPEFLEEWGGSRERASRYLEDRLNGYSPLLEAELDFLYASARGASAPHPEASYIEGLRAGLENLLKLARQDKRSESQAHTDRINKAKEKLTAQESQTLDSMAILRDLRDALVGE